MIASFACAQTEAIFHRERVKRIPAVIQQRAYRKLVMLDAAVRLEDLRVPPGNRLEALAGDRRSQWSIRINEQWRICFRWSDGNAYDVAIVDYHR